MKIFLLPLVLFGTSISLSGCEEPSNILSGLENSNSASINASSIIDTKWEWICGAPETTKVSEILKGYPVLSLFVDKVANSTSDFVSDNEFKVILLSLEKKEMQIHQVNSHKIWITPDYNDESLCYELSKVRFIRHTQRSSGATRPWYMISGN